MNLSIIVPVYNIEQYLNKCLKSLVNQKLTNYEIIIVNDGSTDNSQLIIDKYKKKYPKLIRSFKKKNGGLSSARNYGIKKAKGKYIAFLDGDDYVNKDTYKLMFDNMEKNNSDMVVCDVNYVYEDRQSVLKIFDKPEIVDYKLFLINLYPVVWNKMYKTEIIKEYDFKENYYFEDVEYIHRVYPFIKKITYIDKPLINYVQREGSITNKFNDKIWDYLDNFDSIIKFYKDNNLYEEYEEELEYIFVRYMYGTFIKQSVRSGDLKIINKAYKNATEHRKKYFPKYRNNKYFKLKGIFGIYLMTFNKLYVYMFYLQNKISNK